MRKNLKIVIIVVIVASFAIGISLGFIFLKPSNGIRFTKVTLADNFTEAGRIFGTDIDVLGTAWDADEVAIWIQS